MTRHNSKGIHKQVFDSYTTLLSKTAKYIHIHFLRKIALEY